MLFKTNGTERMRIGSAGGLSIGTATAAGANNLLVNGAITSNSIVAPPRVVTIADGTSITINGTTTDIAVQVNTQAVGTLTVNSPTGTPFDGQKLLLRLNSLNIQTFSWNSVFVGSLTTPLPALSSGGSLYDYFGFIYNSAASKWNFVAYNVGF